MCVLRDVLNRGLVLDSNGDPIVANTNGQNVLKIINPGVSQSKPNANHAPVCVRPLKGVLEKSAKKQSTPFLSA